MDSTNTVIANEAKQSSVGVMQGLLKETLHNPFSGLLRRFDFRND